MMEECTQCKINRNAEPKKGTIISDRLGVRVYHLTVNFLSWQSRYLIIIKVKIFKNLRYNEEHRTSGTHTSQYD